MFVLIKLKQNNILKKILSIEVKIIDKKKRKIDLVELNLKENS
jgi:hypothetical protein